MTEYKKTHIPRFMIAAPSSGSGKTLITCGILNLLKKRGMQVCSFKCGPDFIDPMFHTTVLGTHSRNLDTFFAGEETTRELLVRNAAGADIAVMEGVMGYFDGMGLNDSRAGASDLAAVTDTPVFLIIPAKGVSRSILPVIRGFLDFQEKRCIRGVILNRISPMLYPRMKEMIEQETGIPVAGYVPPLTDCVLESRHLGLVMPSEIEELQEKLDRLAGILEDSLDVEQILRIAGEAPDLAEAAFESALTASAGVLTPEDGKRPVRIGLARDEAFCFFYEDNLQMLRDRGAELVEFSPIHDKTLPEDLDALWLHGGYPELYARELSVNTPMREAIRQAVEGGMPTLAECGGFLYLHKYLTDPDGVQYPMAGVFEEEVFYTGRLTRFGYITLKGGTFFGRDVGEMRSHEFHYYDSKDPGSTFLAEKPAGNRSWRCVRSTDTLHAGFPHLYFPAAPSAADAFLAAAEDHRRRQEGRG